jgi:hypothetical protein
MFGLQAQMADAAADIFGAPSGAAFGSDAASLAWQKAQREGGVEKLEGQEQLLAKGG